MTAPPPWDEARSLYYYKGTVRELIHNLKFKKRPGATAALAHLAMGKILMLDWEYDIIVPMPLSGRRLRQRGFNQCLELARGIFPAERGKIDVFSLVKIRDNPPQSGLAKRERLKNVKNAFKALPDRIKGRRILLLDDIYTTGATAKEAASALRRAGARSIYMLTLARVV